MGPQLLLLLVRMVNPRSSLSWRRSFAKSPLGGIYSLFPNRPFEIGEWMSALDFLLDLKVHIWNLRFARSTHKSLNFAEAWIARNHVIFFFITTPNHALARPVVEFSNVCFPMNNLQWTTYFFWTTIANTVAVRRDSKIWKFLNFPSKLSYTSLLRFCVCKN